MSKMSEHWKWMVKQKNSVKAEKIVKRQLVGDDALQKEIELLEDEVLTLRKENDKLQQEIKDARQRDKYMDGYQIESRRAYGYGGFGQALYGYDTNQVAQQQQAEARQATAAGTTMQQTIPTFTFDDAWVTTPFGRGTRGGL